MTAMYVGEPDEGETLIGSLRDLSPDLDAMRRMPYLEFQAILDPKVRRGNATTGAAST